MILPSRSIAPPDVADAIALQSGERVVDIGTGYGATARLLAGRHHADVTLSR